MGRAINLWLLSWVRLEDRQREFPSCRRKISLLLPQRIRYQKPQQGLGFTGRKPEAYVRWEVLHPLKEGLLDGMSDRQLQSREDFVSYRVEWEKNTALNVVLNVRPARFEWCL